MHIETCIRRGCHAVATHTTANGAYCDEHPCKGEGVWWLPTNYPPGAVADAQALADVRTLDDWATPEQHFRVAPTGHTTPAGQPWMCARMLWRVTYWLSAEEFFGDTPDEARAKAAAWVREQAKGVP